MCEAVVSLLSKNVLKALSGGIYRLFFLDTGPANGPKL